MAEVLRTTPLRDLYPKQANVIDFHGWAMAVQIGKMFDEVSAVRLHMGFADVSHMGELTFEGDDAERFLEYVFTNKVVGMEVGQARYGFLCMPDGPIFDDDILYKGRNRWTMVTNASATDEVYNRLSEQSEGFRVKVSNVSDRTTLIALHGPEAAATIAELAPELDLKGLGYYRFQEDVEVGGVRVAIAARTGYTGEDGIEFMSNREGGRTLWQKLMEMGVTPYGLAARDILRQEAGLPLRGNDISTKIEGRSVNPLEGGLGRFVDLKDKGAFVGKEALLRIAEAIASGQWDRQFVGFTGEGNSNVPRQHQSILNGDEKIGVVTSGTPSPTLNRAIGMGFVKPEFAGEGVEFQVDVRGRLAQVTVVKLPFYKGTAGRKMLPD